MSRFNSKQIFLELRSDLAEHLWKTANTPLDNCRLAESLRLYLYFQQCLFVRSLPCDKLHDRSITVFLKTITQRHAILHDPVLYRDDDAVETLSLPLLKSVVLLGLLRLHLSW